MPPITYHFDRDTLGRLFELETRLKRLESGGVLRPTSPQIRSNSTITGGWPQSVSFTPASSTSTILILWQVTALNTVAGSAITCVLKVDGTTQDTATMLATNANEHLTIPFGVAVVSALTIASHTVQVAQTAGTSDSNDKGRILIVEIP